MNETNDEERLKPHSYDGIQEYDKRLPNWWLFTLYITMAFWVGYWSYYEWIRIGPEGAEAVTAELKRIENARLANATRLDDATLWRMSLAPEYVERGREVYATNCAACHLASLRGKEELPAAIGPSLRDTLWIHGGTPMEIHAVVADGVLLKGMPAWGPVLGEKRITDVVAYLLSFHKEGEPVQVAPPAAPAP